jgi:hypothetical protein
MFRNQDRLNKNETNMDTFRMIQSINCFVTLFSLNSGKPVLTDIKAYLMLAMGFDVGNGYILISKLS